MTSARGLTGLWILTLVILLVATLGDTQIYNRRGPDIPFPPARPTSHNLENICREGQHRSRYPKSFYPATSFSYLRSRGNAINRLEAWYTLCCSRQVTQDVLCCTVQAWKQALSQFCVEEYSTKTSVDECCEKKGEARWTCFNTDATNPNYDAKPLYTAPAMPPMPGFTFNPNAC